jgi:hypothetical protein
MTEAAAVCFWVDAGADILLDVGAFPGSAEEAEPEAGTELDVGTSPMAAARGIESWPPTTGSAERKNTS